MSAISELPLIDEHDQVVEAERRAVWVALFDELEGFRHRPSRTWGARALGCADTSANTLSLWRAGATAPGFRVVEATPLSRVALRGRHHFSEYALEFELEEVSLRVSCVRARTEASFPGVRGGLYRQLVIGTGFHVAAVTATLRAIKRRAEAQTVSR